MANPNETATPQVDIAAIQREVSGLTREQLEQSLLKIRTRAKVQQKKNQGGAGQKAYQMRQRERAKLLKAEAIRLGIWDTVEAQADAAAEAKLAEEDTSTGEDNES